MIQLRSVTKRVGKGRYRKDVLTSVTCTFAPGTNYVILGNRGEGKSTLLRLLCGLAHPNAGEIQRFGNVSIPPGTGHSFSGLDTAREYIRLIATVYRTDFAELFKFVVPFSEIGASIDTAVAELPPPTRFQFMATISYAIPARFYLFDGQSRAGNKEFRDRCDHCYNERRRTANVIHTTTTFAKNEAWDGFKAVVICGGFLSFFDSFEEAADNLREDTASATFGTLDYASVLLRDQRLDEAVEYLEAFVIKHPEDSLALLQLTQLLVRQAQLEKAESAAILFIKRFGPSNQMCLTLAGIMEKRKFYAKAIPWAERQLEIDPNNQEALLVRARSFEKLGLHSAAGEAWGAMISKKYPPATRLAIRAYVMDENWLEALNLIEQTAPADNAEGFLEQKASALINLERWPEMVETTKLLMACDQRAALRVIYKAIVRIEPSFAPLLATTLTGITVTDPALLDLLGRIKLQIQRNVRVASSKGSEADAFAWSEALAYLEDRG